MSKIKSTDTNYLSKLNDDVNKRVVLDTNILLYDLDSLKKFEDNDIIIPTTVVEELNGLKNNQKGEGEKSFASRHISATLKELATLNGNIREGVPLKILTQSNLLEDREDYENIEGKLFIVDVYEAIDNVNKNTNIKSPDYINLARLKTNDELIIAVAKALNARLITRDNNMIIKASGTVKVEEYTADKLKVNELYKGYRHIRLTAKKLNIFQSVGAISNNFNEITYDAETGEEILGKKFTMYPNEFAIIDTGEQSNLYGIIKENKLVKINFEKDLDYSKFSVKPKNIEQKMAMYLLQDDDILAVSFVGQSGKGKTYIGIDYALTSLYTEQDKSQFIYTKSMKEIDKSEAIGTLPGGVDEKMSEAVSPLYSTLESLYAEGNKSLKLPNDKDMEDLGGVILQQGELLALKLRENLLLNVVPMAYLRGRTLDNKIVLFDEAQNSTRHIIKTLTTRMTDKSKLILTGDNEQIDDNNLNKQNNGLSHFVENGKTEKYIAHLTLDITRQNQRGKLAQFGNDKL